MKTNYSTQAKEKLNQMKMESAGEVGVSLKQGYAWVVPRLKALRNSAGTAPR